jgi:Tol biopolymer transport system component
LFASNASNLAAGDTNQQSDYFVKNLTSGAVIMVNSNNDGVQGNGGVSELVFSPDGQWIMFKSSSSNLVDGDTNNADDIFLKNVQSGEVRLLNSSANAQPGNAGSVEAVFSVDGKFIAFVSGASNLIADDTNDRADIFIKTLATGEIKRASITANGTESNGYTIGTPSFSPDGKWLAFYSSASSLTSNDNNEKMDIFIKNLGTGEMKLISNAADGQAGNGDCGSPVFINDDWLKFSSSSSNLAPDDNNGNPDDFIKNISSGKLMMINSATDGTAGNASYDGSTLRFSPDMHWMAFASTASNLINNDVNGHQADVFLKNLDTGEVQLLNTASDGTPANTDTANTDTGRTEFYFSPDSQSVLFTSTAYNLVPGDTNGEIDVFIKQLSTGAIQRLTHEGSPANYGYADRPSFTDDGQYIVMADNYNVFITPNPYWLG